MAAMLAEAQRLSVLQAMGIDAYRLRKAAAAAPPRAEATARAVAVIGKRNAIPARLHAQLPRALGIAAERVQWCDVTAADLPEGVAAYVVIGTEAARALGVQLSTMQQNATVIAATAEPAALLRDGAAKRALWQILKPVARRLREN
jgi:DNA polymerase III psi subunit